MWKNLKYINYQKLGVAIVTFSFLTLLIPLLGLATVLVMGAVVASELAYHIKVTATGNCTGKPDQ